MYIHLNFTCPAFNEIIHIVKENAFLDKVCFHCLKKSPKHDIKYSIRRNKFLEDIRINLITMYFLIFENFVNNI